MAEYASLTATELAAIKARADAMVGPPPAIIHDMALPRVVTVQHRDIMRLLATVAACRAVMAEQAALAVTSEQKALAKRARALLGE